jgi:DNA-binding transcriptional LysR family regulator
VYDKHALGSRDILQLIAVADSGSIRRAAESLGMTQPGLSKNVRQIEERLGIPIFERSTSGATLTDNGMLVIDRGRQVLLDLQGIIRDARDQSRPESGLVRIGSGPLPAPIVAHALAHEALAKYPGISVELEIANVAKLAEKLERGDLDFLLGYVESLSLPPTLQYRKMINVRGCFFVRRGHPLASLGRVPARRLAEWPMALAQIYPRFFEWYTEATGKPHPIIQFKCENYDLIAEAVAASDMVSVASDSMVARLRQHHPVVPIDVVEFDFTHDINLVSAVSRPISRAAQSVLDIVEAALQAN